MTNRVIAMNAQATYRIVQRLPVQGKREYWLQYRSMHPDNWQDVSGPWWQRPAALRKLERA